VDGNETLKLPRRLEAFHDHHTGQAALSFQKLPHQTYRNLAIAAALDQNIKDSTILIDGAPNFSARSLTVW